MRLAPGVRVVVRSPCETCCDQGRTAMIESRHPRFDGWMVRLDGEPRLLFFGTRELRAAAEASG